jgi:hypothetical protein
MTVNEIYNYLGKKIHDAIPHEIKRWDEAKMYASRLEGYFSASAKLYIDNTKIDLEELEARWEMSRYVHELHAITTEGGHNRWNKLEFTLFPDGKFDLQFIWDQEWLDEIDGYNKKG